MAASAVFLGVPRLAAHGGPRAASLPMGSMLHTLSPTELRDICFSTMQSNIIFSSQ
jgi:hypothetical protein